MRGLLAMCGGGLLGLWWGFMGRMMSGGRMEAREKGEMRRKARGMYWVLYEVGERVMSRERLVKLRLEQGVGGSRCVGGFFG